MSCSIFLKLFIPVLFRSALSGWCGAVKPELQTVAEGTTVRFRFTSEQALPVRIQVQWRYTSLLISSTILCDSKKEQCRKRRKYIQSEHGHVLTIKTVSQKDSGAYICRCYIENSYNESWSQPGQLNVIKAQTRASNELELHRKTIYTEITTEYHSSTTNSATAKVRSETEKTGVMDSATEYKVSSTLEDTSQVTTVLVAGVVVLGVMLTIVAVVIICRKQTKNDIHRASQTSGPTQTLERTDGQNNCLLNNCV